MRLVSGWMVVLLAAFGGGFATDEALARVHDEVGRGDAIPFEVFTSFERIEGGNPLIALEPPLWAAATHAIIVDETVHYYWSRREPDRRWLLMHATAPVDHPTKITQDARNPIVVPSRERLR